MQVTKIARYRMNKLVILCVMIPLLLGGDVSGATVPSNSTTATEDFLPVDRSGGG